MVLGLLGISTTTFFSVLLMIVVFALYLNWLPVATGAGLAPLVLPSVALAAPAAAVLARVTRSSMLEELRKDYVRTAYAKGLPLERVVVRRVWHSTIIPVVTILWLLFCG